MMLKVCLNALMGILHAHAGLVHRARVRRCRTIKGRDSVPYICRSHYCPMISELINIESHASDMGGGSCDQYRRGMRNRLNVFH